MSGPPPCLWSDSCHYDDDAGTCPCEDDETPDPQPRPIETVPVGSYL
ncbi:hypothetical protein [Streptomyces fulvorobeus]|uniref:Uncharacterized protein n=1 Tax=Streptomyces fulvorobeus TaxID=284028 RepID=A0A7J0C3I9_9ACTN|nr:hypothetical protein [Streptomyces fulvorobeus]NYE40718.1 hypothetical protein [Streptomyces fulvorobeus]GFM97021.1 hypothetical protein Sfulv_18320 [Streptomyces fulvorobeus]